MWSITLTSQFHLAEIGLSTSFQVIAKKLTNQSCKEVFDRIDAAIFARTCFNGGHVITPVTP
jgi:hypothetical protein